MFVFAFVLFVECCGFASSNASVGIRVDQLFDMSLYHLHILSSIVFVILLVHLDGFLRISRR